MYLSQWEWGTTHNFLYDPSKSDYISKSQYIHLIDAGLEINTAYPLILKPERKVDLILSFDFSEGDPFLTLTEAEKYCSKNDIQFPEIIIKKEDENIPSKSFYIFGKGEKDVPVVMHFPLFNKINCEDNVQGWRDRYQTFKLLYTPSDIEDLLKVSKQIVTLSKNEILDNLQQKKKAP
ncbi:cytosolic phospholipase A2 gamma-like [Pelobates fuscus]|uniref:cytosolic phospholipase A2 gamma-like n=1 Tax=Pelobates fuscus TaxID=191477 RepID=UPI002FE45E67